MHKLTLAITAAAGLSMLAAPASACPQGYKSVWIQGNKVCQLDASASNKLKANTGPELKPELRKVKRVKELKKS